jgi:ATP:corrinoid adenosyltransferase
MWFKAKSSLYEVNEVVPPSELTFLILDEIGYLVSCQYLFCTHVAELAVNLDSCITSKPDVCDDG